MNERTNKYFPKLTIEQAADGMNCAAENARRLLEDARVLFKAKRYPTAVALAILAMEECGKALVILDVALTNGDEGLRECWSEFRNHSMKSSNSMMLVVACSGKTVDEQLKYWEVIEDLAPKFDRWKQDSLYVDFSQGKWRQPVREMSRDDAKRMIRQAEQACNIARPVTSEAVRTGLREQREELRRIYGDLDLWAK